MKSWWLMLEDLKPDKPNYTCLIATHAKTLDDKDAVIYWAAVNDDVVWSTSKLARQLSQRGLKMSGHSLQRHRDKECSCAR